MKTEYSIKTGIEHDRCGEIRKAINCFSHVLDDFPEAEEEALVNLAKCRLNLGDVDVALKLFLLLKDRYPDSPEGLIGCARVAEFEDNWPKALACWEECLSSYPNQAKPYWRKQLGLCLLQLGRTKESKSVFEGLLETHPASPLGRIGLAILSFETKCWDEAEQQWEQCLRDYPEHAELWWSDQFNRARIASGNLKMNEWYSRGRKTNNIARAFFSMLEEKYDTGFDCPIRLKYESVLIVSYGRSGSTLLQGLLNTIDGVVVKGENKSIFRNFFDIFNKVTFLKKDQPTSFLPEQAWYGTSEIDKHKLMESFRESVRAILLGTGEKYRNVKCYGFKEIRYLARDGDFSEYLDFLSKLFPNVAFIFNTRNLNHVVRSAFWRDENEADLMTELEQMERDVESYSAGKSNCFHITYEDMVGKTTRLEEMFAFVGAPYRRMIIDGVLETPHSYDPEQKKIQRLFEE